MKTVYLRNVPDDVVERLNRLAARDRVSLNTFVITELTEMSRRADNAELLAELANFPIPTDQFLQAAGGAALPARRRPPRRAAADPPRDEDE